MKAFLEEYVMLRHRHGQVIHQADFMLLENNGTIARTKQLGEIPQKWVPAYTLVSRGDAED